jgi:putative ABC transport system permease protein
MNEPALVHYGRSAGGFKTAGVAVGNALAALAGALSAQFQGFADVNMGVGVVASSLLAVVLGQEVFSRLHLRLDRPGRVLLAAVAGALAYQTLTAAILSVGAPPTALRFLSGFCLVLVLALRSRRAEVSFSW